MIFVFFVFHFKRKLDQINWVSIQPQKSQCRKVPSASAEQDLWVKTTTKFTRPTKTSGLQPCGEYIKPNNKTSICFDYIVVSPCGNTKDNIHSFSLRKFNHKIRAFCIQCKEVFRESFKLEGLQVEYMEYDRKIWPIRKNDQCALTLYHNLYSLF